MEIIVHGKPYSDSSRQSGGLDESFVSSFTSVFFRESGLLKELRSNEALIVDARNWNGRWYGVYTYALQVVDFANTPGVYFAISVVFPDEYNCFTREVYARLKKVSREYVVGRYLSQHGKYLVKDFGDTQMFEGLVAFLRNNWNAIVESFDNRFVAQNEFRNDVRYNIDDCDSNAYLDAWRKYGRIIITPNTPSKDTLIGNREKESSTIRLQQQTINELKQQLAEAQQKEQIHITTSRKQQQDTQRLKQDNDGLRNDNKRLSDSLQKIFSIFEEFGKEVKKYRPTAATFPVIVPNVPQGGNDPAKDNKKSNKKGVSRIWIAWAVGIAALVLSVATNIVVLHKICINDNGGNHNVAPADTTVVKSDSTDTDTVAKTGPTEPENPQVEYRINILGYSGKGSLTVGKVYTLVLQERKEGESRWSDCAITPQWFINGMPVSSDKLTSNKQESVKISCIVAGSVVSRPNPLTFVNPPASKPARKPKEDKKVVKGQTKEEKTASGNGNTEKAASTSDATTSTKEQKPQGQ